MSRTFLRRLGVSVLAATAFGLLAAGVGGAVDGGPLVVGGLNLGTPGTGITQLSSIDNGPGADEVARAPSSGHAQQPVPAGRAVALDQFDAVPP